MSRCSGWHSRSPASCLLPLPSGPDSWADPRSPNSFPCPVSSGPRSRAGRLTGQRPDPNLTGGRRGMLTHELLKSQNHYCDLHIHQPPGPTSTTLPSAPLRQSLARSNQPYSGFECPQGPVPEPTGRDSWTPLSGNVLSTSCIET